MSPSKKKTILLVEDEAIIALNEAKILEGFGYKVITAPSGEAAVEIAAGDNGIDLILMDIDLGPGMSGPDAAEKILSLRSVPIVFLTSHSGKAYVDRVKKITSYGYVIKDSGDFVLNQSIETAFKLYEANQEILKKEKELERAQRIARLGNWEWDIVENNLIWSDGMYDIFGVERSFPLTFENIVEMVHPEDREINETQVNKLLAGESSVEFEIRIIRPGGEVRNVYEKTEASYNRDGNPAKIFGIMHDVTELKRMEEGVQDSENKFRSITENAVDFIFIKDSERRYTFINRAMMELLGLGEEEILGRTPQEIYGEEQGEIINEIDDRTFAGETVNEIRNLTINERTRYFNTIQTPLTIENGAVGSIMGIVRDVTERIETEEEVRSLLREKEILLKEVHHRIKNNMSTMKSLLSLQARNIDDEPAKKALRKAEKHMTVMMLLYDKLYRSDNIDEISMKEYINSVVDNIVYTYPGRVYVVKKIDDFMMPVGLASPVGIIINELISNSMKYAFKEGRDNSLEIEMSRKNKHLTLILQDNGTGFLNGPVREGFGLRLVTLLTKQLEGDFNIDHNNGTRCTLEFDIH